MKLLVLKRSLTAAIVVFAALNPISVSAAKSWGVTGEEISRFDATVVDILCELSGDCAENCGAGTRQLGLLTADQTLILASKNATIFSGAAEELAAFCGQPVTVDGLFTENRGVRFFAVQFIRPAGGEWRGANQFLKNWSARTSLGEDKAKQWFRHDPLVSDVIAKDGLLGLGADEDRAFLESR